MKRLYFKDGRYLNCFLSCTIFRELRDKGIGIYTEKNEFIYSVQKLNCNSSHPYIIVLFKDYVEISENGISWDEITQIKEIMDNFDFYWDMLYQDVKTEKL